MNVVINSSKTIVLLVLKRFHQLVVYFLLESSHIFRLVFKYFLELWVISSFPFRLPSHFQFFVPSDEIAMNVHEMKDVSSILGNVLNMAIYFMDGLTSISIIFAEFCAINHLKVRFNFLVRVNPDINEGVHLSGVILAKDWVFFPLLPLRSSTIFFSKIGTILNAFNLDRLVVVI